MPAEWKAAIVLFCSLPDEKQRRLYAGLESLKLGYGGDQRLAEFIARTLTPWLAAGANCWRKILKSNG